MIAPPFLSILTSFQAVREKRRKAEANANLWRREEKNRWSVPMFAYKKAFTVILDDDVMGIRVERTREFTVHNRKSACVELKFSKEVAVLLLVCGSKNWKYTLLRCIRKAAIYIRIQNICEFFLHSQSLSSMSSWFVFSLFSAPFDVVDIGVEVQQCQNDVKKWKLNSSCRSSVLNLLSRAHVRCFDKQNKKMLHWT